MRALEKLWWSQDEPALSELWLWPLTLASLAFRAGAAVRRLAKPKRVSPWVISVGNLAVGGTGKTPVAMKLCEMLRARGCKPALLSRGHGRSSRARCVLVCGGEGPLVGADEAGDEPLLIARRLPWLDVLVGPDRAQLASAAISRGAGVLVLDDGLQQRKLRRNIDVIAIDAQNPIGNGRLLPRGPLREGMDGFHRAGTQGIIWLTNAGDRSRRSPQLARLLERAEEAGFPGLVESRLISARPSLEPSFLLAGIARPERFEETVRGLSIDVRGRAFFADHHRFSEAELAKVRELARREGATQILTTEKDAARLSPADLAGAPPIVPLPVELELLRGEALLSRVLPGTAPP